MAENEKDKYGETMKLVERARKIFTLPNAIVSFSRSLEASSRKLIPAEMRFIVRNAAVFGKITASKVSLSIVAAAVRAFGWTRASSKGSLRNCHAGR
jgi:hypothetical protein